MTNTSIDWLAGLMEGEGSFLPGPPSKPTQPIVTIQMADEDVIAQVAIMFGTRMCMIKPRKQGYKPMYSAKARGSRAMRIMKQLRPYMGSRRQAQIDKAIASFKTRTLSDELKEQITTEALKDIPIQQVADKFQVSYSTVKKLRYIARKAQR